MNVNRTVLLTVSFRIFLQQSEKAKEHEEAMSQKLIPLEKKYTSVTY